MRQVAPSQAVVTGMGNAELRVGYAGEFAAVREMTGMFGPEPFPGTMPPPGEARRRLAQCQRDRRGRSRAAGRACRASAAPARAGVSVAGLSVAAGDVAMAAADATGSAGMACIEE